MRNSRLLLILSDVVLLAVLLLSPSTVFLNPKGDRPFFNPKGSQTVAGGRSDSGDLRRCRENTSTPKAVPERK
jgi:hypothetical protein